ncbi:MAG TPA: hypothetical protein PKV47_03055, partial [Bacteroidales bacterium]|nr:hypothetical protein [Bacteroidales bacterium]
MKTMKYTALFLFAALILCTCMPQESPDCSPAGGSITITGQTEAPGTKTIMSGTGGLETHWVAGTDQIAIFS